MNAAEADRLRGEIVDEIGALLRDQLAANAWGRVLVEVVRAPGGEAVVAGIDVEEIIGDEALVDAAFGGNAARDLLPALAKATEALCALDGVELDDVRGGTFVRLQEERFAWLPGLVRAPSARLDAERDVLVQRLRERNAALRSRFAADRVELDVDALTLRWIAGGRRVGMAHATLIATFATAPRTWAWAWSNPTLTDGARRASAALTDALDERDLWEITTPVFPSDEPTGWMLAALICDRTAGEGVQRVATVDGALFVLLRNVRAVELS
jgi:uncharacterized protein DUF6882